MTNKEVINNFTVEKYAESKDILYSLYSAIAEEAEINPNMAEELREFIRTSNKRWILENRDKEVQIGDKNTPAVDYKPVVDYLVKKIVYGRDYNPQYKEKIEKELNAIYKSRDLDKQHQKSSFKLSTNILFKDISISLFDGIEREIIMIDPDYASELEDLVMNYYETAIKQETKQEEKEELNKDQLVERKNNDLDVIQDKDTISFVHSMRHKDNSIINDLIDKLIENEIIEWIIEHKDDTVITEKGKETTILDYLVACKLPEIAKKIDLQEEEKFIKLCGHLKDKYTSANKDTLEDLSEEHNRKFVIIQDGKREEFYYFKDLDYNIVKLDPEYAKELYNKVELLYNSIMYENQPQQVPKEQPIKEESMVEKEKSGLEKISSVSELAKMLGNYVVVNDEKLEKRK